MSELYAVTSGDPAGIGPDISLKIALREDSHQFVVFGNMNLLRERAENSLVIQNTLASFAIKHQ